MGMWHFRRTMRCAINGFLLIQTVRLAFKIRNCSKRLKNRLASKYSKSFWQKWPFLTLKIKWTKWGANCAVSQSSSSTLQIATLTFFPVQVRDIIHAWGEHLRTTLLRNGLGATGNKEMLPKSVNRAKLWLPKAIKWGE